MANEEVLTKSGNIQDTRPKMRDYGPAANPYARFVCHSIVNCIHHVEGVGESAKEAYTNWKYTKLMVKMDDDFHLPRPTWFERLIEWVKSYGY